MNHSEIMNRDVLRWIDVWIKIHLEEMVHQGKITPNHFCRGMMIKRETWRTLVMGNFRMGEIVEIYPTMGKVEIVDIQLLAKHVPKKGWTVVRTARNVEDQTITQNTVYNRQKRWVYRERGGTISKPKTERVSHLQQLWCS